MLLPFFEWFEKIAFSTIIRESIWIYPITQVVHLLFLAIFAGAVLIVDLRLMRRGMTKTPLGQVARDAQPWLIVGFLGLVATGIPQLGSNATKEYYSDFFWWKMGALLVAFIFTFTLRWKVTQADEARVGPFWGKAVGLVSIVLWSSVTILARLIGLLS